MDAATIAGAGADTGSTCGAAKCSERRVHLWNVVSSALRATCTWRHFRSTDADAGPRSGSTTRVAISGRPTKPTRPRFWQRVTCANQSVVWNSALRRFVLMRTRQWRHSGPVLHDSMGTVERSGRPCSRETTRGEPSCSITRADPLVQSLIPIYDRNGNQVAFPDSDTGVPYSPNLLDRFTQMQMAL